MRFAPLQSAPAQEFLRSEGLPTESFESLVFVPDWNSRAAGARLLRTDGALAAFREIGGAWRAVSWLRVLPAIMRDPVYRMVARTRHALFGEFKPSPLGNPDWEKRFIAR
jgi:predicted DCC family thiol-disulfide oxidoreductase YuxK